VNRKHKDRYAPAKELAVYRCACGVEASFCLGWPASPVERWFCRACLPDDFLPKERANGQVARRAA
jgi:hypothetical protein